MPHFSTVSQVGSAAARQSMFCPLNVQLVVQHGPVSHSSLAASTPSGAPPTHVANAAEPSRTTSPRHSDAQRISLVPKILIHPPGRNRSPGQRVSRVPAHFSACPHGRRAPLADRHSAQSRIVLPADSDFYTSFRACTPRTPVPPQRKRTIDCRVRCVRRQIGAARHHSVPSPAGPSSCG